MWNELQMTRRYGVPEEDEDNMVKKRDDFPVSAFEWESQKKEII